MALFTPRHPSRTPSTLSDSTFASSSLWSRLRAEDGAATAEYAIALLAAAGFAGLLVTLLTSDTARGWLTNIIESALSL
ncbi:MAG: DUF4244 domain-containing protein [Bifidobacteriaceae bacterium]|jgi:hypothetical protein|nr:DUF4244 domain-containing protein [Bifidobacteriaceae bacterium]